MKGLLFLISALFISISFSSCEDDKEFIIDPIIGTKKLTSQEVRVFLNGELLSDKIIEGSGLDFSDLSIPKNTTFKFNESGAFTALVPGEPVQLGYWELNNSRTQLILNSEKEDQVFQIHALTSKTLSLAIVEKQIIYLNGYPADLSVEVIMNMH
ncbi:hypothetical protein [Flexithrix dorotheae]|uniref:hypothetical protein n=1 Tax=Flexithrix dorotheae TaxID=70993 RepID=UPI0003700796|nr:hypothetical protein [Flexithrix dorotheae]